MITNDVIELVQAIEHDASEIVRLNRIAKPSIKVTKLADAMAENGWEWSDFRDILTPSFKVLKEKYGLSSLDMYPSRDAIYIKGFPGMSDVSLCSQVERELTIDEIGNRMRLYFSNAERL